MAGDLHACLALGLMNDGAKTKHRKRQGGGGAKMRQVIGMRAIHAIHACMAWSAIFHTCVHPPQELEALDERIAGVGSGPEEDYLSHWSRLINKYGISTPKIQVWASMELRRLA